MSHTQTSELAVRRFICSGEYQENCYLVHPGARAGLGGGPRGETAASDVPCWIIDPGFGVGEVLAAVERDRLKAEAIVLTHGHLDHIAGIPEVRGRRPGVPIWIGRGEADALQSPEMNMSGPFGVPMTLTERPDRLLDEGEQLSLGGLRFRVIGAPGHSRGGLCLLCERSGDLFVGDVLFAGSIGRSDIPGADGGLLVRNIREKLLTLPGATRVWPGHGPATTIATEKAGNPFLGPTPGTGQRQ